MPLGPIGSIITLCGQFRPCSLGVAGGRSPRSSPGGAICLVLRSSRSLPALLGASFAAAWWAVLSGAGVRPATVTGPRPPLFSSPRIRLGGLSKSRRLPCAQTFALRFGAAARSRSGSPALLPSPPRFMASRSCWRLASRQVPLCRLCARLGSLRPVNVLRGKARLVALWRGFRSSPAPLPLRFSAFALALLPLPARRVALGFARFWPSAWPRWLVRAAGSLGGYLVVSSVSATFLWLLVHISGAL